MSEVVFQDGWYPDAMQAAEARRHGELSDVAALLTLSEIFSDDSKQVPPVVDWKSFIKLIDDLPPFDSEWWNYPGAVELFTPSQSYRPNCAGFAMANAAIARLIIQNKAQWAELKPQKFNPMVTWMLSKGGSVSGGQTLSKIARYGNQLGNYLAKDVGGYDPKQTRFTTDGEAAENAALHQIGVCYYEGTNAAEDLIRCLKHGYTAFVGQSNAVRDGVKKDENGVSVVTLGGTWAHATAFAGYKQVGGDDYVFWINSHGNIYRSDDGTPDFGGWMNRDTLERFLKSTFCDICIVTYTEAVHDEKAKITLRP